MPLDLAHPTPGRFHVRVSGDVTVAEIDRLVAELASHPDMSDGVQLLVDAQDAGRLPTEPQLRRVARSLKPIVDRGLGPTAVVTSSPFVYGVSRMFGIFVEAVGATYGTFWDVHSALTWLEEMRAARTPAAPAAADRA